MLLKIAEQTGARIASKRQAQFSTLNTGKDRQFLLFLMALILIILGTLLLVLSIKVIRLSLILNQELLLKIYQILVVPKADHLQRFHFF
ncbi:hypothetical protein [Agarilytica rhodophyticola]|uniref:hypothetical protein n=1 Tax=Agarilytica rhodophyticola TaxID=1737490 RepID=UPI000B34836F|nr:hypothetical protein [Agarilytica rhodophyticola]